jgi:pilus assembly protein CpaB
VNVSNSKFLKNPKLVLLLSILVGSAGSYMIYSDSRAASTVLDSTVKILVAAKNIESGDTISPALCEAVEFPKAFVPLKAVYVKQSADLKRVTAVVPIPKGQPILWNCTTLPLHERGLASRLNKGERAFSMRVNEEDGISGVLRAGNFVDILATYTIPNTGGKVTRTLLQNMPVLSFSRANGIASFRVTPEEAELLAFASEAAKLRFTLRAIDDKALPPETPGVDFSNLKAAEKEAVEKKSRVRNEEKPRIVYD